MKRNNKKKKHTGFLRLLNWIWRFFSSVRLAVILILVITGLSLIGALLIQAPTDIIDQPQAYSHWVNTIAVNKTGTWTPIFSSLQLFNIFRSPWFIIACSLLMFNIFVCSLNRWSDIKSAIVGGRIKQKRNFYLSDGLNSELRDIKSSINDTARAVEGILRQRKYRTRAISDDEARYIKGDKNGYFRLGTYFSHFSLILFVLAFIMGSYFGFRDLDFTVAEGSMREVGYNTGLALQLVSFTDDYYENGTPRDYSSEVILYEGQKPVKEATIQVNHPLNYKGVRFYQSYFGPAVVLEIKDQDKNILFHDSIALERTLNIEGARRLEGIFELQYLENNYNIRLISSATNIKDTIIPPGHIAIDIRNSNDEQLDFKLVEKVVPRIVGGLEFTFLEEAQYSGFQISRDPANIIIWIASALFIIGICTVLYFPYRQAWVMIFDHGKTTSLLIKTRAPRGFKSTSEKDAIIKHIQKELGIKIDK